MTDTDPWLGALIDARYRVTSVLGQGAMGVVYCAEEIKLKRLVAIKRVASKFSSDPRFEARFLREAQAQARIRHENVVQVYTFGEHDGSHYLAMEHVAGPTLERILAKMTDQGESLPPHQAVRILERAISGAGAIHHAGLLHGDLKPSNVVIEEDSGRPVIIDFGVSTSLELARELGVAGSPIYMAPERCSNSQSASHRSDIYSLGCLAFELLSGCLPFEADTVEDMLLAHMTSPVPRLSDIVPELASFDHVLGRALAKHPDDRFGSCAEMAHAFATTEADWSRRLPRMPGLEAEPSYSGTVRILVVDDDEAYAKLAVRAAQLAFFRRKVSVKRVASGRRAVAEAAEWPPSLLLLDGLRPEVNGVATVAQLRDMPHGDDVRVVVMGGNLEQLRWRFASLGVRDFLDKPVAITQLVETIADIARRSGWLAGPTDAPPDD